MPLITILLSPHFRHADAAITSHYAPADTRHYAITLACARYRHVDAMQLLDMLLLAAAAAAMLVFRFHMRGGAPTPPRCSFSLCR